MKTANARAVARPSLCKFTAACLGAALLAAGCGGGDRSARQVAVASPLQVSGTVADGPIEGALVFLDLNGNQLHDSDEPVSSPTDARGRFTLVAEGLTQAQIDDAMLVTHVPDTARDADDGGLDLRAAGRRGFTLMTPASAYLQVGADGTATISAPLLSPLTTLVAAEMSMNGRALGEARTAVAHRLALQGKDPMTDFVTGRDQALGAIARTVAISMGEIGKSVADAARAEGGQSAREQVAATITALHARLPVLLDDADRSGQAPVRVGEVRARLSASTLSTRPAYAGPAERASAQTTQPAGAPAGAAPQAFRHYVVTFKDSVGDPASQAGDLMRGRGGQIRFTYATVVKGFAVTLPEAAADAFVEAMARNPNVDRVEVDQPVTLRQTTQSGATWGLDRSDQRDLPLSGTYTYGANGAGVRAYVVDTGILSAHVEFGGRVAPGYSAVDDGNGTSDCNGHGTHVAGTIGAATWGVAKGATLVPVRVLDCAGSGRMSGVIAGLDWVAAHATLPAVVNMSLGGGASATLDAAVANTVARGVGVVVAAGNDGQDACNISPAREPSALTVGATTSVDARASYSNFGACVDLFAPGSSIKSAWYTSTTATNTISGTSMASPHVAGVAALLLQSSPGATPAQVADAIKASATAGKVTDAGAGSPNLLLYSVATLAASPPPAPATAVSVGALVGSAAQVRNGWRATVAVTVRDAGGTAVAGAVVNGGFSVGGSAVKCTTGTNGACSVTSGNLSKGTAETRFSVTSITGSGMSYDATANVASSLLIRKP